MDYLAFIYFACATFYIISGAVTLFKKNKGPANWTFGILCLVLSQWTILLMVMSISEAAATAAFYRKLMIVCWSSMFTLLLYFVLFLSKNTRFYDKLWKNMLLILPGSFCLLYYFLTPIDESFMVSLAHGWAFANPVNRGLFWDNYFTIYYITYCLTSLAVVIYWYRKTTYQRERLQARLIIISIFSTLLFGSITDVLLPSLGISQLPPLTPVYCIVTIALLNYASVRYRMMSISPESIMMDVFMMLKEGLIITDSSDQIATINSGAEMILGYKEADLKTKTIETIFSDPELYHKHKEEGLTSCSCQLCSKEGQIIHALISCHVQYDEFGNKIGTVFTFQNINKLKAAEAALAEANQNLEKKVKLRTQELEKANKQLHFEISEKNKKEERIRRMIYQDSLTKLNNRRFFYEYMEKHIAFSCRYVSVFAILFLDLDGFKLINDSLGHDIGDQILIKVAERLKEGLRSSDIICRAGGDEFMILLHNTGSREDLSVIAQKVLDCLQDPIPILNYTLHISASIGIAIYPEHGMTSESLIKHADIAMYQAKDLGKGCYVFYDADLKEDLEENLALTNDLYSALDNGEFELFYQPQVNASTQSITGFEALIRWNHSTRGRISPGKFIPLAERTGLIIPIGEWVLKTAALQQKDWERSFGKNLKMGINLSIIQLKDDSFVDQVSQIITDFEITPANLELEFTETIFMEDTLAIRRCLHQLKELGVQIAIDDFGTEYSSLSYLKKLPLHRIKIPKPFVDGIGQNQQDEAIIVSIIVLAIKLGCSTIAEGVETAEQLEFLEANSCDDIQGYYFYRPMPADEIEYTTFIQLPVLHNNRLHALNKPPLS